MIEFHREPLTAELFEEALPLLKAHYDEIAHFKDIPLDPDKEQYISLELAGVIRAFTVRVDSKLVGYAVFFVKRNLHYKTSIQALQDVLYVDPACRKSAIGGEFIRFCDRELEKEGVQVGYHHIKAKHNFGVLLERMNYELVDLIYARRFF